MENSKIVENIVSAIDQLKEKWPGGWLNILRIYLKPMRPSKISVPLYYSKINPNDVAVPVEIGVKQTRLDKINEMLAQKSKKLRLDRKTKKIVKVKGPAPAKKDDKSAPKKDKKRKLAVEEVKAEEPSQEEVSKKSKKKKKTSESEAPVETPSTDGPTKAKKQKKQAEPVADVVPLEGKKKKKSAEVPAETVTAEPKKKKNKKNKA